MKIYLLKDIFSLYFLLLNCGYCQNLDELIPTSHHDSPTVVPKFVSRGHLYKAIVGDTIELPCKVQNLGTFVLLWRRGSSVISAGHLKITRDDRFKIVDDYNLQISNVKTQDAGDYICQIGDQETRDQVHTVEILVPPTLRAVPQNGQVAARKGSTVTLECKASGNPVPSIYWFKKDIFSGSTHLSDSSTLILERVDRHHAGVYQCAADNGVREPVSMDINLTILSPPEITVERSWVHASEGYDIELACIVHGDVTSDMMWYQNSFLLDPTDRRSMQSKGDRYTLTIRNFQPSDFGNYSCVADNALGRTKKYIEISGRPGPAEFISPTFSGSLEVYNLTWSVESIPPLEEIRLLYRRLMMNETYQHPGKWHDILLIPTLTRSNGNHYVMSHVIRGLEGNSVYEAIVQAKNRYGWNEISDIHQFYTRSHEHPIQVDDMEYKMQPSTARKSIPTISGLTLTILWLTFHQIQ
ncbi:limbic system-associated membrane protein [Sitodiplosis mosellana]|uniref:limbic system-associated membrane protein n=1 Tax=Sitodiplosis mosellana TaxID=263140 RepID=UPI002444FB63|nr:limbic system-associated membrane protein [Sitodiplosis mosellana]XP_055312015.1 limbic system-associated membrane protein [Sitodiplosis mosellana]